MFNKDISELNSELSYYKYELHTIISQTIQNQSNTKNQKSRNKNDIEIEEHLISLDKRKQSTKEVEKILEIKEKIIFDIKQYMIKFDLKINSTIGGIDKFHNKSMKRNQIKVNIQHIELNKSDYLENKGCKFNIKIFNQVYIYNELVQIYKLIFNSNIKSNLILLHFSLFLIQLLFQVSKQNLFS